LIDQKEMEEGCREIEDEEGTDQPDRRKEKIEGRKISRMQWHRRNKRRDGMMCYIGLINGII
jgi:hypothetical protein